MNSKDKFSKKYTAAELETPNDGKNKITISIDAYVVGEMIEKLIEQLENLRLSFRK